MRDHGDPVDLINRDLHTIFGSRLHSLTVYGESAAAASGTSHDHRTPAIRTLAVVETLTHVDLRACANRVAAWQEHGLATPLVLAADEFGRSLDAFPLEFGAILADHRVVSGADPFGSLAVDPADLRRACEVQARSHLLHLREGYFETRGRADALSMLIVDSAPALAALVTSLARLEGHGASDAASAARQAERAIGTPAGTLENVVKLAGVDEISSAEAERLFPPYLDGVEQLVRHIDKWSGR